MKLRGDCIKRVMQEKNVSNTSLSIAAGVTLRTLNRIFQHGSGQFQTAWKIAKALDVPVAEIVGAPLTPGMTLKKVRLERGLTRGELADLAGIEETGLADWEADINMPQLWSAYYVSSALGLTINECFGLEVDTTKAKELYHEPN